MLQWNCRIYIIVFCAIIVFFNFWSKGKERSKCIGFHCSYLKFWCESVRNPNFLPTFNYHFLHSLDLCLGYMKPFTDFMFEVVHFQINVWFLPLTNLVFDDICSPFIEVNLRNMFQRSLYDYICKLHFTNIICRNKQNKDVKVLFFYHSCERSNNQSTIQVYGFLVSWVDGYDYVSRWTKSYWQSLLLFAT